MGYESSALSVSIDTHINNKFTMNMLWEYLIFLLSKYIVSGQAKYIGTLTANLFAILSERIHIFNVLCKVLEQIVKFSLQIKYMFVDVHDSLSAVISFTIIFWDEIWWLHMHSLCYLILIRNLTANKIIFKIVLKYFTPYYAIDEKLSRKFSHWNL